MKVRGKVSCFDSVRGFGYICDYDANSHFVHYLDIVNDEYLKAGQLVEFEIGEDRYKRKKAIGVKVVEDSELAEERTCCIDDSLEPEQTMQELER